MYFDLTDEQKSLREMLTSFFEERFGAAQGVEAADTAELDRELWSEINALGLGGILIPEDAGGLGMGLLTLSNAAELCGMYAVPAPIVQNALAAWLIGNCGDDTQRQRWLEDLVSGSAIAAFALGEHAGWLPKNWTGSSSSNAIMKQNVERASEADLLVVGLEGGKLALLPTSDAGATVTPIDTLDRSRPLADVTFDPKAAEMLAASPNITHKLIDALLITYAADALGAALGAQARAVAYAKERSQFGRLIGSFQAIKHQLADMSVDLEPARPLYWYAAHAWDADRLDAQRMAAIVKAHIGDIAVNAARMAIEVHGGIGYTWEYPAHLLLKRAMFGRAVMGMPALHRERAAALAGWRGQNERKSNALGAVDGSAKVERLAAASNCGLHAS